MMMSEAVARAPSCPREDDRYPSRSDPQPRIEDRRDAVVHGGVEDGPLDEAQLAFYRDNGYLQFDALLTAVELQRCLDELDRLRSSVSEQPDPTVVVEPGSRALRSIFDVHRSSIVLGKLCHHPTIAAIARQLLGSEIYIHQSRINYKGGFRGQAFYWHSDFETWHVEDGIPSMRMLSCSISLTPNTPHNGPLMLIPGSHKHFVTCVGATPEDHYKASLKNQEIGVPDETSLTQLVSEYGITAPTGPAGTVTFFECNIMHGSNSNITPMPRSNVFVVYNSVLNKPVAPYCGLAARPNFIAERRDFTHVAIARG